MGRVLLLLLWGSRGHNTLTLCQVFIARTFAFDWHEPLRMWYLGFRQVLVWESYVSKGNLEFYISLGVVLPDKWATTQREWVCYPDYCARAQMLRYNSTTGIETQRELACYSDCCIVCSTTRIEWCRFGFTPPYPPSSFAQFSSSKHFSFQNLSLCSYFLLFFSLNHHPFYFFSSSRNFLPC